jgi:hypothetical protein
MTNARARLALFALLVAVALSTLAPASAGAFVSEYNCVLKPVGEWCDGRANGSYDGEHSWDYNQGWYPGAWDGTVTACQRVWKPSTGGVLSGSSCAANITSHYYGNVQCVCYDAEVRQYSGGPHSINGYADAAY